MKFNKLIGLLILLVAAIAIYLYVTKAVITTTSTTNNLVINEIRAAAKIVIWEEDFTITDFTTKEKQYLGFIKTKEALSTTINGRMGFHIDLADSINTQINPTTDTVFVIAPLQLTYIHFDLATLKQIKEASLDPTLEVSKEEVVKHLNEIALQKKLPQLIEVLKVKPLDAQQQSLSKLVQKPVVIKYKSFPTQVAAK